LRAARREHGRSLSDAAAETRIRETYLAALEEEDFATLGGDVYVRGFLRSYARFLGLDPEPLVEAYRRDHEGFHEAAPLATEPVQPMPRERQPGIAVIVTAAGVLLLVLAGIGLLGGGDEPEETARPGPTPVEDDDDDDLEPLPDEPLDDPEPSPDPLEDEPAEPVEGIEVVVNVPNGASWMRITVDGQNVFEGEQSSGYSETFEGEEQVSLRLGDPSAVTLVVNGEEQAEIGQPGIPVNLTCDEGETTCDVEEAA
jgi:cytoskeleton protein RodZ